MVKNKKISYYEQQFKEAHMWATGTTGAGLQETDVGDFESSCRKKCQYYFDLLPIMGDRAMSKPKATSDELDISSSDDDSSSDSSDSTGSDSSESGDDMGATLGVPKESVAATEGQQKSPAGLKDDGSTDTDELIAKINNPEKDLDSLTTNEPLLGESTGDVMPVDDPSTPSGTAKKRKSKRSKKSKKKKTPTPKKRKAAPSSSASVVSGISRGPRKKSASAAVTIGDPSINEAQERLFTARAEWAEAKRDRVLHENKLKRAEQMD